MKEYYEILGLSENATDEEIEAAYEKLRKRLKEDMFAEGEKGNKAARDLTKVETAYAEIKEYRKKINASTEKPSYEEVEAAIRDGRINDAQEKLDGYSERDAEWHYLQSVVFYKKNWLNESKKQLELAMNLYPANKKYSDSYAKIKQKMEYTNRQFTSGNAEFDRPQDERYENRQMGGDGCSSMCECCTTMLCANMMCNMCCR